MSEEPFEACWDRLERVGQHRAELADVWNRYIEEHPYDFALSHQGEGVYVLEVWEERPMPAEFALEFGEWLYNARACLDYIIWATSAYVTGQLPPPNEQDLQYPVYETEAAWKRNERRLVNLAPHHREMLLRMQPFCSNLDANYLRILNHLARVDRHRRLTISTSYLAEMQPVIAVPANVSTSLQWGQRVLVDGHAQVARITVSPWEEGIEVSVNPRMGIDPDVAEWSESPFWRRIRFTDRLKMIEVFLEAEIATYEYDCRGSSRKADLLADRYREECDQRGRCGPIRRTAAADVEWGQVVKGSPSTQERFEGIDFPTGAASVDAARGDRRGDNMV